MSAYTFFFIELIIIIQLKHSTMKLRNYNLPKILHYKMVNLPVLEKVKQKFILLYQSI